MKKKSLLHCNIFNCINNNSSCPARRQQYSESELQLHSIRPATISKSSVFIRYFLIIQASVLMNVIADQYVATFGAAEFSPSLVDANVKIDKRYQGFVTSITKMGIASADIYVDITTQTQVAD